MTKLLSTHFFGWTPGQNHRWVGSKQVFSSDSRYNGWSRSSHTELWNKQHLYGKSHAHCGSFYAQTGPSPAIPLRVDDWSSMQWGHLLLHLFHWCLSVLYVFVHLFLCLSSPLPLICMSIFSPSMSIEFVFLKKLFCIHYLLLYSVNSE